MGDRQMLIYLTKYLTSIRLEAYQGIDLEHARAVRERVRRLPRRWFDLFVVERGGGAARRARTAQQSHRAMKPNDLGRGL